MKRAWACLALALILLLLAGCAGKAEEPAPAEASAAPESSAAPEDAQVNTEPAPTEEALPLPTPEPPSTLTLWAQKDAPFSSALQELCQRYSARGEGMGVTLWLFAGQEELLSALDQGSPDLLLCDGRMMLSLRRAGRTAPLAFAEGERPETAAFYADTPDCFQPLGAELPVLVLRDEGTALLADVTSFETLCATARHYTEQQHAPFFSADCWARLFAGAMAQCGGVFTAERERDLDSPGYREFYNLLAEAAFEGALSAPEEPVLSIVRRGELVCGICGSRDLFSTETEGLAVLPVPALSDGELLCEAEVWGLAALSEDHGEEAAQFIVWLCGNFAPQLALSEGYVPALTDWDSEADALGRGLAMTMTLCRWRVPAEDDYAPREAEFDRCFRARLALLEGT